MKEISEYEQQGIDFLKNTNTEMSTEFKEIRYDKENYIFNGYFDVTLRRGSREFKFEYGCSHAQLMKDVFGDKRSRFGQRMLVVEHDTLMALCGNHSRGVYFTQNGGWKKFPKITPPTPYDVLACLTKSDPGTFEDFCGDYGYDEDSRKAEQVYQAVKAEWENVQRLFTDAEIQQLQEIN